MSDPEVSVIIASFNGRRHLERCLPALRRSGGVAFEVILADNGSRDGTVAWVQESFPDVKVLAFGRNLGFGEANRRGVAAARADLIAFLNSDTEVDPDWLAVLVRTIRDDERIAAACSTLVLLDRPELVNARGGGMTRLGYGYDRHYLFPVEPSSFDPEPAVCDVLFPTAAAMLMRRDDLAACGGFDRAFFMYHEDVDLGWRLRLAGRRVVVCRDSVVRHARGGTALPARGRRWKDRLGIRYAIRSMAKSYSLRPLARALAAITRLWMRRLALGQASTAVAWNLWHLPGTLWHRRRVQRRRRIADAALLADGLIVAAPLPPVPPAEPRGPAGGPATPNLLATPLLRPGYHSALGRLGFGWYAQERGDDGWLRWTCGHARCFLRVEPAAAGRVIVTVKPPDAAAEVHRVALSCNGAHTTVELSGPGWQDVSLPAAADESGRLDIRIGSPRRECRPPRHPEFRDLGCAVDKVRFAPDAPQPRRCYRTVSVIVPTYNRWAILAETLDALAAQTASELEVIVVDDGSTDGTWERLQGWKRAHGAGLELTLLRQENAKPGRARNHGLRHAGGDLVLFIGDDIIPGPELVAQHLAKHNEIGDTVAVLGFTDWHRARMRTTPFLELINRDGQQFAYGHFRDGDDVFYTCLYTSNVSLPREVLGAEPFHPAFTFVDWEDVELGYRLSLRGLRIVYHAAATARHLHPMSMAGFYRRQVHVGRTVEVLLRLHPELAGDDALPPPTSPRWFVAAHPFVRAALPLLSWYDARGWRLPRRMYRLLLLDAYYSGRRKGWSELAAPGKRP